MLVFKPEHGIGNKHTFQDIDFIAKQSVDRAESSFFFFFQKIIHRDLKGLEKHIIFNAWEYILYHH